ncbi:TcaA second domain-containing protein [Halalkalibacter wakoensis]|uniref:TcaA second domain-containing protein n=1 Tax=Halalkalibacter wakoensis TaxID=127891 RepID=UPI003F71CF4F
MITAFTESVEERDMESVSGFLVSEGNEITNQHVEYLLDYLHEHPDKKEQLLDELTETVRTSSFQKERSSEEQNEVDFGEDRLILFQQRGKHFFLFNRYEFVLQSFPLMVHTDQGDIRFFLNGEEISSKAVDNGFKLGSILPGYYHKSNLIE